MPVEAEILGNKKKTLPSADTGPTQQGSQLQSIQQVSRPGCTRTGPGRTGPAREAVPSHARPWARAAWRAVGPPELPLLVWTRGNQEGQRDLDALGFCK